MMTPSELIARAERLQSEAHEVLADLGLLSFLAKYGRPEIVGSTALGLMTRRDIDIDVVVSGEIQDEDAWEAGRYLLAHYEIALLLMADDRGNASRKRPPSMYVGAKYRNRCGDVWKIDIRFVQECDAMAPAHVERIGAGLTAETKRAILSIKDAVAQDPRYGQEFSGVDVYEAVLHNGVTDPAGFRKYLMESGIDL